VNRQPPEKLYQTRPVRRLRPPGFTEDGWHTLDGFLYESDKLARCVMWARRRYFQTEFTSFASINITEDVTAAEMKVLWSKVARYLKNNGVVALYTCEASRNTNRFNFHLLLRSETANLKELLKFATKGVSTNVQVRRYDPGMGRFTVRYMVKARTTKYKNNVFLSRDRWARKRVLFRKELKVRKYGWIGDFLPPGKNKDVLWKEIIAHERRISEGLQEPGAEDYAAELHELVDGTVSLDHIRRSVGYHGVPVGWTPKPDEG
jgi:hypothetical protein